MTFRSICKIGHLTAEGALQHVKLGNYLRRKYKESTIFDCKHSWFLWNFDPFTIHAQNLLLKILFKNEYIFRKSKLEICLNMRIFKYLLDYSLILASDLNISITSSIYPRTFQSALALSSSFIDLKHNAIYIKASNTTYFCADSSNKNGCACQKIARTRMDFEKVHYINEILTKVHIWRNDRLILLEIRQRF